MTTIVLSWTLLITVDPQMVPSGVCIRLVRLDVTPGDIFVTDEVL